MPDQEPTFTLGEWGFTESAFRGLQGRVGAPRWPLYDARRD